MAKLPAKRSPEKTVFGMMLVQIHNDAVIITSITTEYAAAKGFQKEIFKRLYATM